MGAFLLPVFRKMKGCSGKHGYSGKRQGETGYSKIKKEDDGMAREFSKAFYNSQRWRKCAKAYAESKLYICERCHNRFPHRDGRRQRYIVHHKIPLTPDNIHDDSIAYGWDNLMLLCIECHNAVHGRGMSSGRRMQFDENGNLVGFTE